MIFEVGAEALVAQVPELVLELLERIALVARVPVLHLRPPREAGPHEVAQRVEGQLLASAPAT